MKSTRVMDFKQPVDVDFKLDLNLGSLIITI